MSVCVFSAGPFVVPRTRRTIERNCAFSSSARFCFRSVCSCVCLFVFGQGAAASAPPTVSARSARLGGQSPTRLAPAPHHPRLGRPPPTKGLAAATGREHADSLVATEWAHLRTEIAFQPRLQCARTAAVPSRWRIASARNNNATPGSHIHSEPDSEGSHFQARCRARMQTHSPSLIAAP